MPPLQAISALDANVSPRRRRASSADRFIPARSAMNLSASTYEVERAHTEDGRDQELNASPAK